MLVGYLIGHSHMDSLAGGLSLDRFLSEDTGSFPDIDLDFPRDVRERLISRVIEECGFDRVVFHLLGPWDCAGFGEDVGTAVHGGGRAGVASRWRGCDQADVFRVGPSPITDLVPVQPSAIAKW